MAWKEEKVLVSSGKRKACVRKETNAPSGKGVTIVHKNQNTTPPHFLSHPSHEAEVCRGKEVSVANVTMVCQFYKTETGCKAGDKSMFPHHKVDEQSDTKPKKGYYSHTRRESDDKNAVAIVKIVPQLGCVSQD